MTTLLDTDVLIDCLRGVAEAMAWLKAADDRNFQVPGIVAMELMAGCRNRREVEATRKFLNTFVVVWTTADEFQYAFEIYAVNKLSSGLSIPDCLIAAMAISRNATLYTFNLKHFQVIQALNMQAPYTRL